MAACFQVSFRGATTVCRAAISRVPRCSSVAPGLQVKGVEPTGGEGSNRWYQVDTIGANGRELRSLVERQGATVSRVLRVAMGGLKLERTLGRGQVRQLSADEIDALLRDPQPTDNPAPDR